MISFSSYNTIKNIIASQAEIAACTAEVAVGKASKKSHIVKRSAQAGRLRFATPESRISYMQAVGKSLYQEGEKVYLQFIELLNKIVEITESRLKDRYSIVINLINRKNIDDLLAGRHILKNGGTESEINNLMSLLLKGVKDKKIEIIEIKNYCGDKSKPYFNPEQLKFFKSELERLQGKAVKIKETRPGTYYSIRRSGHTGVNMTIKCNNAPIVGDHINPKISKLNNKTALVELQISGAETKKILEIHHRIKDIDDGKDISRGIPEIERIYADFKAKYKSLGEKEKFQYNKYWNQWYQYARELELGRNPQMPVLPPGLDPVLSYESLENLNKQAKNLLN